MKPALKVFGRFLKSAMAISRNPDKMKEVIEKVDGKVESEDGPLGQIFVKTRLTGRMITDFLSGRYNAVPARTVLVVIAAALYIISPLDAVFDWIPFMGYVDDIFIFNLVYGQISKDLAAYMAWAQKNPPKENTAAESQVLPAVNQSVEAVSELDEDNPYLKVKEESVR